MVGVKPLFRAACSLGHSTIRVLRCRPLPRCATRAGLSLGEACTHRPAPTLARRYHPMPLQVAPGSLLSLELACNGVVSNVFPESEAGAIGLDLFSPTLNSGKERPASLAVVSSRALTLVGPLPLFQGGIGARARIPIFVDGPGFEGSPGPFNGPAGPNTCAPCAYNGECGQREGISPEPHGQQLPGLHVKLIYNSAHHSMITH